MAKNGEAGRALGAALMSSLVGAVFGALALGAGDPDRAPARAHVRLARVLHARAARHHLRRRAQRRRRAQGPDRRRASGSGSPPIGLDPVSGTQRYTFGQLFLWDGIGLVPVTIGFFAIPEVIDLAVQGSSIARLAGRQARRRVAGREGHVPHWALVLRCSAIGDVRRHHPRHGRGDHPVAGLRPRRAELARPRALRPGRRGRRARPGRGEQLDARRQPGHHRRLRRARQRHDGDPDGRLHHPGPRPRARHAHARAQGPSRGDVLDGLDHRGRQRRSRSRSASCSCASSRRSRRSAARS